MAEPGSDKARIGAAFKALRGLGVFARQSWQCCQSCGCAAVPSGMPYAFYHLQDAEAFAPRGRGGRRVAQDMLAHPLHVAFGAPEGWAMTPQQVGALLAMALRAQGLTVDWDGTEGTRVAVLPAASEV